MNVCLSSLTEENFKPYGQIIEPNSESNEGFQIVIQEPSASGWQIAISQLTRKPVLKLGLHPNTRESFEPISGITAILVAKEESPHHISAFLLEKPVCLFKNVWHATVSLSDASLIKITENCEVDAKEYVLKQPLEFGFNSIPE